MTTKKSTAEGNVTKAAHKDPALIPNAIYHAEGSEHAALSKNMFISSEALDRMLPMDMRDEMVLNIDRVATLLEQARTELLAHTTRRSIAVGKGFRNYGFMMASNQSMNNFPQLAPNFVDIDSFNDVVEDYLFARDVSERLMALSNDAREIMNIFGNLGFNLALAYYNNVRAIADRTGDQTAVSVYEILRRFFNRKRTPGADEEPTVKELERHFHALLHHKSDGEIDVKNFSGQTAAGVHEAIDTTHKPEKDNFKVTVQGTVTCPQCNAENVNHARFCINCGHKF